MTKYLVRLFAAIPNTNQAWRPLTTVPFESELAEAELKLTLTDFVNEVVTDKDNESASPDVAPAP